MRYLDRKFNGFTWWRHVSRIRVKLDEAVRRWKDLDKDAQKMWGRLAEAENRRIKAEKDDLEMRASADLKTGLFGSIDQSCPLDVDELSKLLHEPNSRLEELFRQESLSDWKKKLAEPSKAYVPTARASDSLANTLLPGEKCRRCKELRQKWMTILLPMRASVRYHYKLLNGSECGLTMCLVWEDRRIWFEVSLLLDQPESILGIQIPNMEVSEVADADGVFGPYPEPYGYTATLPDIFSGESFDLIELRMAQDRGCPPYFVFVKKSGVLSRETGWYVVLNNTNFTVSSINVDLKAFKEENRRRNKKRKADDLSCGLDLVAGSVRQKKRKVADTDALIPDCEEEPYQPQIDGNGIDFLEGEPLALREYQLLVEDSDDIPVDRNAQGLGRIIEDSIGDEECVEIEAQVLQGVNITRYSAFVYRQHSVAIVLFRDSEEGMVAAKVKESYLLLKAIPGAKALRSRFTVSLNRYPMGEIVRRLRVWTYWHSAWVYDERPPIAWNEPNLPLPSHMVAVPLRVWSDSPESVTMHGNIVCGDSDKNAQFAENEAAPSSLIETADADDPMELCSDNESQDDEEEEKDDTNNPDTDDEWLDLFEGIDLSSYG